MGTVDTADRSAVAEAVRQVVERIADMIRESPHTGIEIPGSTWTVGEAAAHLAYTNIGLALMARGLAVPHGDGTRAGFAQANEASLEGFTERDGMELAGRIVRAACSVLEEAAVQPPDRICPTPMGEVSPDTLVSYLLTHNLMHGCDIAYALDAPAPFEATYLELVWPFVHHALERLVESEATADLTACVEMRAGDDFAIAMNFDRGELTVSRVAPRQPDCLIESDPLTFFLMATKVMRVTDAVQQGLAVVSGPRPELGASVMSLFQVP